MFVSFGIFRFGSFVWISRQQLALELHWATSPTLHFSLESFRFEQLFDGDLSSGYGKYNNALRHFYLGFLA